MSKKAQDYTMPIEWLTSMLDINRAIKITSDMSKDDVRNLMQNSDMRRGSFAGMLLDSYAKYVNDSDYELYMYYDIGCLSGSAGFIKVVDNKIVGTITVIRS
jgi:hypothetical protein